MRCPARSFPLLAAACFAAGGCAVTSERPPTPAAKISPAESAAVVAPPGERYFLLVFGSDTFPKRPKYTHTWASVVRVTGCDGGTTELEEHTISWMPATLDIRPWSFRVEPGTNLPLHFTIEEMLRNGEAVSVWGPYEVSAGFYQRFLVQKAFMESGRVGYQCIDTVGEAGRCGNGSDCIHAVTDMDPEYSRGRYPLLFFGEEASRHIVRQVHIRPVIIRPDADHSWLLPMLGLDRYPIRHREYRRAAVPNTPENVREYLSKTRR